jgi:hypothetical protein
MLNNVPIFFSYKKLNLDPPPIEKVSKWLIFHGFLTRSGL